MITSTVLAATLVASCSWDNPGANPYSGPVPVAVQRYTEIPKATRDKLQSRMESRKYDEVVTIGRDFIAGENEYENLRSMHFGKNKICQTVSRTKWKPDAVERGLVYCEDSHCVIVPTVCNNVSLVTRKARVAPLAPVESPGAGFGGPVLLPLPPEPIVPMVFGMPPPIPDVPIMPPETWKMPPAYWIPPSDPMDPPWNPGPRPPIPEPGTWLMMILGLVGLGVYRKLKS